MYPDAWPNNHILNTLITKLSINFFGKTQWAVRLPNLLFFIIYCLGVFRLLRTILGMNSALFLISILFFFANAYLLDFFSLCRGYGISIALVTLSLSYLLTGYIQKKKGHIWLAFFYAILASYANFTALVYWASLTFFCLVYFLLEENARHRLKLLSLMLLTSMAYLILIFVPIKKMTSTNQFQYWSSNGFYEDTIFSLVEHWRYNVDLPLGLSAKTFSVAIIVLVGLIMFIVFRKLFLSNNRKSTLACPLVLSSLVLMFTALVSILQTWILATPSLNGRTALFFYPLFATFLVSVLSLTSARLRVNVQVVISTIASFIFCLHFYMAYNPNNVREWWYDESTFEVLEAIKDLHPEDEKISLQVNWHFHRSFFFYKDTDQLPWLELLPYNKEIDPDSKAQYYYVMEGDVEQLQGRFKRIKKLGWDRWLLQNEIKD